MPPFMTGGGMINQVSFDHSTYAELPDKFDAGTPNVAGAVGLAAAVNYLNQIGLNNIHAHEMALTKYALEKLTKIKGLKVFGPLNPTKRTGLVAFTLDRIHAHDVAQILDRKAGVAVRSGHHCTMPIHVKLNLAATTRASFYLYNDNSDIDSLVAGLNQVKKIFA
jgi:cysteine desulfurase/selenocysteine lyase